MGDGYFAGGTPHKIPSHRHGSGPYAACPLGERKALLIRSVKSAFALLLRKVTKPGVPPITNRKGKMMP